jgi:hypothetical protein
MVDVAALYIDPLGPYPALLGPDACWDETRDARLYAGELPVVAHPPCQLWTNMARLNFKRYGGEHNRPGNDGGCFASALAAVRRCGGVLEHPGSSWAFREFGLTIPRGIGWHGGQREWVCEVWQSAYGHRARKRTWLLYVGNRPPLEARWERNPGTHQCGWFDRNKPTLGKREASESPLEFASWLIQLARHA